MARIAFQAAMRAAAVTLLTDYRAAADIYLQVYPGRPDQIKLPAAFVESISENITYTGQLHERVPTVTIVVVHGTFDSKGTVAQRDAFVDGFIDWVLDRYHTAGANTMLAVDAIEDIPDYAPTWTSDGRSAYFATRISLEGRAGSG